MTQDSDNLSNINFCSPEIYYNSNFPKFPLWSTYLFELFCIVSLFFFNLVRSWYLKFDNYQLKLYRIQNFLYLVSLLTFVWMTVMRYVFGYGSWHNFVSQFIRIFYLILTSKNLRSYWKRYLQTMYDSRIMVLALIIYISWFSWMC